MYTYMCECQSNPRKPAMRQTKVNAENICVYCNHYAYLTKLRKKAVIHTTLKTRAIADKRLIIDKDWIYN